ncbi:MAG: 1-deoxy-D-xylulose-5-phosphate reductoisomerase [Bacteroidales bacterium]|jgi:1-deoxy-D-xylulose-5-phosphate reductoisomerase|nr:1-deoxy-D-xylulose-5-phosphate reductoisomerase [Bacteroidales bacterium]
MKKKIAILGSTGSIGTQTLDVIASHPEHFEVETLTANNNVELLARQAIRFQPNAVVIGNEALYGTLKEMLAPHPVKVYAGRDAIAQVAALPSADMVVTAMVGFSGLAPTVKAIEAGRHIALANKETLVVAGELITQMAMRHQVALLPVDSEHSAIFQCLQGEQYHPIEKLILTASGGPFRTKTAGELAHVTREEALQHPSWNMGAKITVDSATLMNKGLEVIEARWLFDVPAERIEVLVHPQSVIHSMVQFMDGSVKAQLGVPDMKAPIQYALSYPRRLHSDFPRLDFSKYASLTFEKPDMQRFPAPVLAFQALKDGGNRPCVMNAANEAAVEAFLHGQIGFTDIPRLIEQAMQQIAYIAGPTLDQLQETHRETVSRVKFKIQDSKFQSFQ